MQTTEMVQGYWTTKDLCDRLKYSSRTISRLMKRKINPLPQPRFHGAGSCNRWAIDDVVAWEDREQKIVSGRAA